MKLVAERRPILVACDIHPWMKAYIMVFDHPFFAVTAEDGSFEIKGVPAGEQNLVVWQEKVGYVNPEKAKGTPVSGQGGRDVGRGAITIESRAGQVSGPASTAAIAAVARLAGEPAPCSTPRVKDALMWRHRIGRLLQVLGMLILPFGIASELVGKVGLGQSLLIAAGGTLRLLHGLRGPESMA